MAFRRREESEMELGESGGLNVVSLIDIFVILTIFLLKSYSAQPESNVTVSPKLRLPLTTSEKHVTELINIVISKDIISIEGKTVSALEDGNIRGIKPEELMVPPVFEALQKEKEKIEYLSKYNPEIEFKGEINLISDKEIPFSVLKKILFTAGQVGFGEFKFVAQKQGE